MVNAAEQLVVFLSTATKRITLRSSMLQRSDSLAGAASDVHDIAVIRGLAAVLLEEGTAPKRLAAAAKNFALASEVMTQHRSSAAFPDLTDQIHWNFVALYFRTVGLAFSEILGDDTLDGMDEEWGPLLTEDSGAYEYVARAVGVDGVERLNGALDVTVGAAPAIFADWTATKDSEVVRVVEWLNGVETENDPSLGNGLRVEAERSDS